MEDHERGRVGQQDNFFEKKVENAALRPAFEIPKKKFESRFVTPHTADKTRAEVKTRISHVLRVRHCDCRVLDCEDEEPGF